MVRAPPVLTTRFANLPLALRIQSARAGVDRLQSEVLGTAKTARIQAIRLFPATFGSDRQCLDVVQRVRFKFQCHRRRRPGGRCLRATTFARSACSRGDPATEGSQSCAGTPFWCRSSAGECPALLTQASNARHVLRPFATVGRRARIGLLFIRNRRQLDAGNRGRPELHRQVRGSFGPIRADGRKRSHSGSRSCTSSR